MSEDYDDGEDTSERRSIDALAVSSVDPFKVRGLNQSDASGADNPTGVLGRTTGSGQTYGVQGVTGGDASSGAAGVLGRTSDGDAYGLKAIHGGDATGSTATYVEATSTSGDVKGMEVRAESANAGAKTLVAKADAGKAVVGESEDYYGVEGAHTSTSGTDPGVYGRSVSDETDASAVEGRISPGNNRGYGVLGVTRKTATDAAGVWGKSPDAVGQIYGVRGTTGSAGTGAAGVRGEAPSGSGTIYGVHGTTASQATDAAGVRGEATAGTGQVYGVYGTTNSASGYAVCASGDAQVTDSLDVTNEVSAGSMSSSGSVTAAGVLDVGAYQKITQVGATAYLGSNQSISDLSKVKVPYNVDPHDDFSDFDTGQSAYITSVPGDYHVTASVLWGSESFSTYSDNFSLYITVDGKSNNVAKLLGLRGRSGHISKTIRDLPENATIEVWVFQSTGGSATLRGNEAGTYVTIDKIG